MNPTKTNNSFLSYFVLFVWGFLLMEVGLGQNQTREIKVGVVLDLNTTFSKICLTSINMALSDFYKDHPNYRTRLAVHVRDSMKDTVQASAAALDLIKNERVSAIIGPRNSMQAEFMIRIANKTQVPTITFSATSPLLTSIKSPYFVRATIDDSSQVKAIAAIVKSFGWRSVVAIYVDNELGKGIMPYLSEALQDVQVDRSVISPEANDDQILKELYKLMTRQTRVFVVHMDSRLALRIFQKAREIGMMEEGYVWLMTNGITHRMRHIDHGRSLNSIEGVLGVRSHVPKSKKLENFRLRWKRRFEKENPSMRDDLDRFGLWAYDSITALAMAVEKTNLKSLRYKNGSASKNNMTDLGSVGVSSYGPSLLKALWGIRFNGLAGEFNLIDGQLKSPKFEIINFVGNDERIIGFWTQSNGLVNANSNKTTSFTEERFGPVIWPGKSTVVPKGWEIPTNGKKIKVGVPVKRGFLNFVEVITDPITNITTPKGYTIDIFEAALKKLPYSVIPQYYRFELPDDDYNDLVYKVDNGTLDALAGDVTITAHRSLYADFTLPFTESGVSMMVRVRDNENKNTWVFLKPWSLDLWVTTGCFFVLIGFVVWLFEHRVNTDFRGPPHHQIGTSFWFSFSTMVFAHREKVVSNLARFVVVVWCFVVLVLTQSYTANLTAFLTVQRFQPAVTNVNDLIKNGDYVGYQHGAFVKDILRNEGFNDAQLKPYDSSEECDAFLSNGSIAAAFDEVAYLKAILSEYCSKYVMVEPTFKTAGFGFAFPKNSPLTGDVSRAILNVTQGDEMRRIENKWSMKQNDCPDPKTALSSNRLSLRSFWGLFLIAGIASFLALLVFVAIFLYEHRHTLCYDSEYSMWRNLMFLFRAFDEKDIKSHTFKNSAVHNVCSPMTDYTPSSSTVQTAPWPQSSSQNREFELRRVSFTPNEECFITQTIHHDDEASDIECGVEQQREV
uniref:Glutamate receptor n=1 Tax=Boechera divaricarpa TaxID=115915 RepID=B6REL5_9BRAS|nr:glutamate receptor 3 [Boechera divaricarpa]